LIARTIVNLEEKWYVKLYGDPMLVTKLNELGYRRLERLRTPFKMYGFCPAMRYTPDSWELPYIDIKPVQTIRHPETFNHETGMFDVTISP
jgi:hypothetical protein